MLRNIIALAVGGKLLTFFSRFPFLQVVIIEVGGRAFSTHSLPPDIWLWCVFLGLGVLLWGQV